jgi:hypothetical protein
MCADFVEKLFQALLDQLAAQRSSSTIQIDRTSIGFEKRKLMCKGSCKTYKIAEKMAMAGTA